MNSKFSINDEIIIDFNNEISVNYLIRALDKASEFKLYEVNDDDLSDEKNILIKIKKNKKGGFKNNDL